MQLYGLAQQRHMLASMGIDIWIPREISDVHTVESSLYRDIAVAVADLPMAAPISFSSSQVTVTSDEQVAHAIAVEQPNQGVSEHSAVAKVKVPAVQVDAVTTATASTVVENIVFPAFELQAAVLPNCILLIESSQLTLEQQKLWVNIQAAQTSHAHLLKWPFALEQFQDGRGVMAYVQGFLAAIQQEQRIIALGELPTQFDIAIVQLPSLQEMLDQPLLKRQLWQHMLGQTKA